MCFSPAGVLPPAGPLHLMFFLSLQFRTQKLLSVGGIGRSPKYKFLNCNEHHKTIDMACQLAKSKFEKHRGRPTPMFEANGKINMQMEVLN
jgi:hypothetical protein